MEKTAISVRRLDCSYSVSFERICLKAFFVEWRRWTKGQTNHSKPEWHTEEWSERWLSWLRILYFDCFRFFQYKIAKKFLIFKNFLVERIETLARRNLPYFLAILFGVLLLLLAVIFLVILCKYLVKTEELRKKFCDTNPVGGKNGKQKFQRNFAELLKKNKETLYLVVVVS